MERWNAIYARQSVDRMDSISIESQIDYCQYEIRGDNYKTYTDKGYSGKNTDRPGFQSMMQAIRSGEVSKVLVYRLDRISRSVLDFMNLFDEFQKYHVEFVSCTEKFDTSTPMGRAMLKIIVVFAELERETIQQRVYDAYISRSRRGFYMGGKVPYGYRLEPYLLDGKKTAHYVQIPEQAAIVKKIFQLYANPQITFGDIINYLKEKQIPNDRALDGQWKRSRLADMIKNPVYVRADLSIYHFFQSHGSIMHDTPEDYNGYYGCYLYADRNAGRKQTRLEGQHVVLAPHEGMVASDLWLKTREKSLKNCRGAKPQKAKNTWLAGKIKCGKCGYALIVKKASTGNTRYLMCSRHLEYKDCVGVGGLHADELESLVLRELRARLQQIPVLHADYQIKENPRRLQLSGELFNIRSEIEQMIQKLNGANEILFQYINAHIRELDRKQGKLQTELNELEDKLLLEDSAQISDYMDQWEALTTDDKRCVASLLISEIRATEAQCEIFWRF